MKKLVIASALIVSSLFAYFAFNNYNEADINKIKVSLSKERVTSDNRAYGDVHITNNNVYPVNSVTIRCIGPTDDVKGEVSFITYKGPFFPNSSKTFSNEYLGHYSSTVNTIICIKVIEANKY